MFCSQCGNRVPDGARFCGLCGTKMSVEMETPEIQRNQVIRPNYSQGTTFDWSGVRDEPHKKYAKDVVSPWSSTGLPEEAIQEKQEEVSQERSRTMSFIDILKKEREEKALEEEAEASRVAEEERAARAKTSSVYIPPIYDDVSSPVITPFDTPLYSINESQQYVSPMTARPEMTIPPATTVDIPRKTQPIEYAQIADERYNESIQQTPGRPSVDYAEANKARLTAELSSYLDAGADRTASREIAQTYADNRPVARETAQSYTAHRSEARAVEQPHVDPYVNRYADTGDITDMYLSMEHQRTPRSAAHRSHSASGYESPIYEAPMYDVPEHTYRAPQPVYNNKPVQTAPATGSNTAEIEALKARLAELMGTSITGQVQMPEPVMVEPIIEPTLVATVPEQAQPQPEPTISQVMSELERVAATQPVVQPVPQPVVQPAPQTEVELPLIDPTPEVEEELPLFNDVAESGQIAADEPVVEQAVAEDVATDAMSVKDLEKSLFGEVSEEDIQAEETKKIDKFYTLYKKNEEFQRLLDEEYNKLKTETEEVPTVSSVLADDSKSKDAANNAKYAKSGTADKSVSTVSAQLPTEADDDDEETSRGGAALTVIAVIIAVLLVVLLAVILVLNFAPDSAIALQIDSIIEMITSYFSGVEVPGRFLL